MVKKKSKKKKEQSRLAISADLFQWVVVFLLVFTSASLVLSNFDTPLRFRVFSINSGSMKPAVKLGDLVFVFPRDRYYENEIISFSGRANLRQVTTHRIFSVSDDRDLDRISYVTKGDANEDPDSGFILHDRVIGKVVFKLPLLGFLVAFAKTRAGFTLLVVIPATILVYSELSSLRKEVSGLLKSRKKAKEKAEKVKIASKKKEEKSSTKKRALKNIKKTKIKRKQYEDTK